MTRRRKHEGAVTMKKSTLSMISILIVLFGMFCAAQDVFAVDPPHNGKNSLNMTISCTTCHFDTSGPTPSWATKPTTTDETYFNNLCTSCHIPSTGMESKYVVKTHSSSNTSGKYGAWTVECRRCHNPHLQDQVSSYPTDSTANLATGTIVSYVQPVITSPSSTINVSGPLTPNEWIDHILVPNIAYPTKMYHIRSNTTNAINVSGVIDGRYAKPANIYVIRTGTMVIGRLATRSGALATVKFFTKDSSKPNSYGSSTTIANVTGICQVCHQYTTSFNSAGTGSLQASPTHPVVGTQACTDCHIHTQGFQGGCNACHGYPPESAATLIFKNKSGVTVTSDSGAGPGAHKTHIDTVKLACANCHANGMLSGASAGDDKINIGFNWNSDTTGSYVGNTGRLVYPLTGTAVTNGTTYECSNLYCHSSGQGSTSMDPTPVYATPKWNDPASGACGTCHGVVTPLISTGSHTKHLASDTNCGNCHAGASVSAYDSTNHINRSIDVASGYTSPGAPGNGYGTCTASCHNAYGSAGIATPQWGANATCGSCHPIAANGAPATGSHALHIATVGTLCGVCHTGAVMDSAGGPAHLDTNIDVTQGYPLNVAKHAAGAGYASCSTAVCHGAGSPVWGGNTNNDICTKCHGAPAVTVDAANKNVIAPPVSTAGVTGALTGVGQVSDNVKVGAHQTHLLYSNGVRTTGEETIENRCEFCHGPLPAAGNHADGSSTPEGKFQGLATRSGAMTPTYAGTTCSNTYCHNPAGTGGSLNSANTGADVTPAWTNAAYIADGTLKTTANCGVCHKSPWDAGFTSTYNHGVMTTATDCFTCHGHNGDTPGVVDRRHIDGKLWGAGACDACHDYDVDAVTSDWGKNPKAIEGWGAHATHIRHLKELFGATLSATTDTFGGVAYNQVCGVCHTKLPANHAMGGSPDRSINFGDGSTTYLFSAGSPTYAGVAGVSSATTPKTCSNVSCHFQASPFWEGL